MAKAKQEKPLCVNDLPHAEYYGMQESFDDLYARSRNGERFTALMDLILNGKTFCWPTGISKPITAAVRRERTM